MKRRTLPVATAFATLLLAACGGGSEDNRSSSGDKVANMRPGAEPPEKPAEPSAPPADDEPDGVDVSLPADVDLVFDWNKPKNRNEAAATSDAANFFRAIYRGVDKRTPKDPAVTTYSTGEGLNYAKTQIDAWIDGGWTATGTLRHYDATTRSTANGDSVEVAFCADSGKFYGKEIKTEKILRTEPGIKDFDHYKLVMVKASQSTDLWQASKVFVETRATNCR
ncbi:hypothetical protein [Streptomyces sp. NPDC050988]|uniref:hypothetical protein n=1 Tax=Streptomyces sp. NPDC050988 TaxID=3365637 RepID=UPI0037876444